jgi:hypothetical protein
MCITLSRFRLTGQGRDDERCATRQLVTVLDLNVIHCTADQRAVRIGRPLGRLQT